MKQAATLLILATGLGCQTDRGTLTLPSADLPAPQPWTRPKTSLPAAFVEETAFLLAHGLGDPRGGVYGAAKAEIGSAWGRNDQPAEVHGWLLPGKPARIVSLGGLVLDVRAPAGKASISSDVQNLAGRATPSVSNSQMALNGADQETAVRLLLIAGRPELAERLYGALPKGRFSMRQPFLVRWFHQAVEAHMAGDDATALRVGRAIVRERPAFTKRLLDTVDPRDHAAPDGRIVEGDPFPFLDVLPDLVADAERRLKAPPRGPFDPKTASVATLIERLDDVSARQWGQPGGVNLLDDPIVAALAAKGAEAADPLFDTMVRDRRLTRSVSFGRDFFPGRVLITVRQAALAAFQGFAQTDNFPAGSVTRLDVPKLRAYWEANKGKTGPDRWFATLADDKAGWRRWEEAERRLFDPRGTQRNGFMSQGPAKGAPYAEAVRGRSNPSLSDLLERRAIDILDRNDEGLGGDSLLHSSLHIATDLGAWDPPRSVSVLRTLTRRTIDALGQRRFMEDYVGTFLVPALEARAKAGDATAWRDYVEALGKVERFPSFDSLMLRPMVVHADVPEVREATRLLVTPGSVYDALGRLRRDPGIAGYDPIVVSPLLQLPVLRDAVTKGLDDRSVIGVSWIDDRGNGWFEASGKPFPSQGVRPGPHDPKPKAGERRPLRFADVLAHDLARLKGAPKFQPYWTIGQKDEAIARMRAFLKANEGVEETIVPWPNNWKTGLEQMAEMREEAAPKGPKPH